MTTEDIKKITDIVEKHIPKSDDNEIYYRIAAEEYIQAALAYGYEKGLSVSDIIRSVQEFNTALLIGEFKRYTINYELEEKEMKKEMSKENYKGFSNYNEADAWTKNIYEAYCEEYAKKEYPTKMHRPIEAYSKTSAYALHAHILNIDKNSEELLENLRKDLNDVIKKAPRIPENIVVFHGVHTKEVLNDIEKQVETSGIYTAPGILCTTLLAKPAICHSFIDTVLRIRVPSGSNAMGIEPITKKNTLEILFPEGWELKYISKHTDSGYLFYDFEMKHNH